MSPTMTSWDDSYAELVTHHKEHGHCNVPRGDKKYPKLGNWVQVQRTRHPSYCAPYRMPLRRDQINRLNALGFWVDVSREKQWNDKLERLKRYKLEYGDCLVLQRYNDDPSLGKWVHVQRTIFKRGTMDLCRVEQLNSIGFYRKPLRGGATHNGDNGVERAGFGDRKRKAQEPPCYENTSNAPQYSSPGSISKDGLKRRSTQMSSVHSKKKMESAKSRSAKAASPKAKHSLKQLRKAPHNFSHGGISDDFPKK